MKAEKRRADDSPGQPPPERAQTVPDIPSGGPPPAGTLPPTATNTSGFHVAVPQRQHVEQHPTGKRLAFLSLTALGIVYGDIGTSPLYALQQVFNSKEHAAIAPTRANVYGVLSLIVWLLILVVAVKYIVFIMRADNRGEGGILALMALILQKERRHRRPASSIDSSSPSASSALPFSTATASSHRRSRCFPRSKA